MKDNWTIPVKKSMIMEKQFDKYVTNYIIDNFSNMVLKRWSPKIWKFLDMPCPMYALKLEVNWKY